MESSDFFHGKFLINAYFAFELLASILSYYLTSQITEIVSTALVLHLANKENPVKTRKVLVIVGVSVSHIIASSLDQFVKNVLLGEGYMHQIVRDVGFMIPDIFHLVLPLMTLKSEVFNNRPFYRDKTIRRDLFIMVLFIVFLLFIISLI